jgi:hypothetical protein
VQNTVLSVYGSHRSNLGGGGYGGGPIFGKLTPAPGPLHPSLQVLAMPRIARILAGLTKVAYKLQFENV